MARLWIEIEVSPALADLANREAWRVGLGWREWIAREAQGLLEERAELVCWPTERERAE